MKPALVDLIRRKGKIAATELASLIGKHKSTVSPYLQELLASGVLREAGTSESGSKGGKPRIFLELNPNFYCTVGIDVSSDRLTGGIYDFQGNRVHEIKYRYTDRRVGSAILFDLYDFIEKILYVARKFPAPCLGIGVGFSGHIDGRTGRVYQSKALGLRDYDLASDLRSRFGLPISVQNDANAALLGEKWFYLDHSGCDASNIVYFFIDNFFTSVGFGLMIGGTLYEGFQSLAGELSVYSMAQGVSADLIESMRSCNKTDIVFSPESPIATDSRVASVWKLFDIYANELIYVFELLNPDLLVIGGNFDPGYSFFLEHFVSFAYSRMRAAFDPYITLDVRAALNPYPPVCAGATVPLFRGLLDSL